MIKYRIEYKLKHEPDSSWFWSFGNRVAQREVWTLCRARRFVRGRNADPNNTRLIYRVVR